MALKQNKTKQLSKGVGGISFYNDIRVGSSRSSPGGLIHKIAILQEGGKRCRCKKTKPKTTGLFQKLRFLNLC